jgi:hypothetical protein
MSNLKFKNMNFTPPPSKLVERDINGNSEYILTVNDIVAVCPYKAPVPQLNQMGAMSHFAFSACGSSCPLFALETQASTTGEKIFVNLACSNGYTHHPIEEIVYLPPQPESVFSQDVVEVVGEELNTPTTGKVFKL